VVMPLTLAAGIEMAMSAAAKRSSFCEAPRKKMIITCLTN